MDWGVYAESSDDKADKVVEDGETLYRFAGSGGDDSDHMVSADASSSSSVILARLLAPFCALEVVDTSIELVGELVGPVVDP